MLDERELLTVARRVVGDPYARLLSVEMRPLTGVRIAETTGEVLLVEGSARTGDSGQRWSAVLKTVRGAGPDADDPDAWTYWRREVDVYERVTVDGPPEALRRPVLHLLVQEDDSARLWLERVHDQPRQWQLEHFDHAAHALGLAQGSSQARAPLTPFLPSLLAAGGWWATHLDPDAPEELVRRTCGSPGTWRSPTVSRVLDDVVRAQWLEVWRHRHALLRLLHELPQVLCHGDLHRRNVLLPPDGAVVAVDWAFAGPGALGSDLADLVWGTLFHGDADADDPAAAEAIVLEGFERGARRAGWSGDAREVRLAYLAATALRWALLLPGWIAW